MLLVACIDLESFTCTYHECMLSTNVTKDPCLPATCHACIRCILYIIHGCNIIIGTAVRELLGRAPHIRDMCARSVYVYIYVWYDRHVAAYVLYSSAHFISEAQCSPETARAHVRSMFAESAE